MVKLISVLVLMGVGSWAIRGIEPMTAKIIAARTATEITWALVIYFGLCGVVLFCVCAAALVLLFS